MTLTGEAPRASNLVRRATGVVLRPAAEWRAIAAEPATVQGLFTGYAMILAAVPPVCTAIGLLVFGVSLPGVPGFRPSPVSVVVLELVNYLVGLATVFAAGLVIDALAPSFDGARDRVQAMKVAVYGWTAVWMAGILGLFPFLGPVAGLVALAAVAWNIYIVYKGLPILTRSPPEKAGGFAAVVAVAVLLISALLGFLVMPLTLHALAPAPAVATAHP